MPDRPSERPRLWLLVSCGWGFRNYVRSDLLERLSEFAEITVFLPPDGTPAREALQGRSCAVETLRSIHLPRSLALMKGVLTHAANVRLGFWDPYLWQWMCALQPAWKRPYLWAQKGMARLAARDSWRRRIQATVDHRLLRLAQNTDYPEVLAAARPDMVISCNPYNPAELPPLLLALDQGIPVLASVISWDNLTYLGPIPETCTRYAVWGPSMREDLFRHIPGLPQDRVTEVGSPQFDFHMRTDLEWGREEFFRRVGGDPARGLLVHAANPHELFLDEPDITAMILEAVRAGRIRGNPQVLVRPHPHDVTGRFERLKARYPELMLQIPWAHTTSHSWWFTPRLEDLALLSNTLRHADLLINTASSMSLDAAIFDTPVLNVAFAPRPRDPLHRRVPHYHQTAHYSKVFATGAVRMAFSLEELIERINTYLDHPELDRPQRRLAVERICGPVDGRSTERFAGLIRSLVYPPCSTGMDAPPARNAPARA